MGPNDTYNEILGSTPPPGGKAVAGIAQELREQDANETTGTGKLAAGMGPENQQNTTSQPVEPTAAAPTTTEVVQSKTSTPVAAAQPEQTMTYTEMIQKMSPYAPPTPEELEKQKKRERQKRIWAAIGDGIAAFSNLYFAGKTGFSNYKSMSKPLNERLDKMQKERDENQQRYLSLYMTAKGQDDAADRWRQDFNYRSERDKARADEEARRWQEQFDYKKDRDAKADKDKADDAKRKDAAEKRADDLNGARINTEKSRQAANYALSNQRNASAKEGGSSGGGKGSRYTLQIGEETKEYGSVSDYNRDVEAYADYYGIDLYEYEGTGRKRKQKRKPTAQLAAEVEKASGVEKDAPQRFTPVGSVDDDDFNLDDYEEN